MCGISGIIYKTARRAGSAPVGRDLIVMLEAMTHRGKDSSGVTVAGEDAFGGLIVRLWIQDSEWGGDLLNSVESAVRAVDGEVTSRDARGGFLRLGVGSDVDASRLADSLISITGVELHSIGRSSEVIKDVGTPFEMDLRHQVTEIHGTHGIGHVRMATESRVDISHAHPFRAYPFPDITVVHNGQLTNYHQLKRSYEDRGHRFQTQNDSEIIAVYLADKLAAGPTFVYGKAKKLMYRSLENEFEAQLQLEGESFAECAGRRDFREGGEAFIDKRKANFTGA